MPVPFFSKAFYIIFINNYSNNLKQVSFNHKLHTQEFHAIYNFKTHLYFNYPSCYLQKNKIIIKLLDSKIGV